MNGWFPPSSRCCPLRPRGLREEVVRAGVALGTAGSAQAGERRADSERHRRPVPLSGGRPGPDSIPKLVQTVPEQLARRFNVVPVGQTDSYLEVATANPFDIDAEKMLAFATGREVRMLLGSPSKIREKLDEIYRGERRRWSPGCSRASAATSRSSSSRTRRTRRGQRRAGQPAPDHPAGGHDDRRRDDQPGERHPRRADRGRGGGPLPHRRRAAPGDEDPAQRRAAPDLPHQDHVRARHRRPAAAAGRPRPRLRRTASRSTSASRPCRRRTARRSSSGS